MSKSLRKWKGAFKRFRRARRGTAAVEFALVGVPFLLIAACLAEIGAIGFTQATLDDAVAQAGRQIRTGRAQMAGVSYGEIQEDLCDDVNRLLAVTCLNNLYLDVDRYASFVDANGNVSPISNNQFQTGGFGYSPGDPSDIVVVRAYYRWRMITPFFGDMFANVSGNERILVSTMMFRNEPYQ